MIASIPARCALAGVLLGLAAFAADSFEGATGVLMQLVAGGGFAWGCAGLAAGYVVRDRRAAMMGAVTLLAVATVVYYGVIAATGVRWRNATLEDGTPATMTGLREVAVATVLWLAASVVGGVALGLLGHAIRRAAPRLAGPAALVAFMLLAVAGATLLPMPAALLPAAAVAVVLVALRAVLRST
ncbi:MAG TPA: hypothetical protein VL738_07505 [Dactylosporangium sp.]|nr:hypothetical protein [Dactylosporangium sp.]